MALGFDEKLNLRLKPLAACVSVVLAGALLSPGFAVAASGTVANVVARSAHGGHAARLHQSNPGSGSPGRTAPPGYVPHATSVGSCADDGGPTTLRSLVGAAMPGDTIDLSALTCSTITLTQGAISISVDTLTLTGPAARVTIDGAHNDRVIYQTEGGGTLTLNNINVVNGTVVSEGGLAAGAGIDSIGALTLNNSSVSGCYASGVTASGGGVYSEGLLTLNTSTVSNNVAKATYAALPGAKARQPSAAAAVNLHAAGGGVYAKYGVNFTNSTITGNQAIVATHNGAYQGGAIGGGVYSRYSPPRATSQSAAAASFGAVIVGSTIDSNSVSADGTAYADGGGLYVYQTGLSLINSTISGNSSGGSTGGLELYDAHQSQIYNSTIADNSASSVGGVYLPTGYDVDIHSTIIAGNTSTGDTSHAADLAIKASTPPLGNPSRPASAGAQPAAVNATHDLVTSADAAVALPPTTLTASPLLLALANNGGPTRTMALGAGSPAINTGDNLMGLTTDQRGAGFVRVAAGNADIGAFETAAAVVATPAAPIPTLSSAMMGLLGMLLAAMTWRRREGARGGARR